MEILIFALDQISPGRPVFGNFSLKNYRLDFTQKLMGYKKPLRSTLTLPLGRKDDVGRTQIIYISAKDLFPSQVVTYVRTSFLVLTYYEFFMNKFSFL